MLHGTYVAPNACWVFFHILVRCTHLSLPGRSWIWQGGKGIHDERQQVCWNMPPGHQAREQCCWLPSILESEEKHSPGKQIFFLPPLNWLAVCVET
mmetsp:Transcript_27870/g.49436  ORF Transcript_27870/g.49436 Transcript_27870/m.49436 type:complete len:96 (+) Transcript_27870:597-884(+)